jgi:hypothetical protein
MRVLTHQFTGLEPKLQQLGFAVSAEQSLAAVQSRIAKVPVHESGGASLHAAWHEAVSDAALQLGTVPPLSVKLPQQSVAPHWPVPVEPAQSTAYAPASASHTIAAAPPSGVLPSWPGASTARVSKSPVSAPSSLVFASMLLSRSVVAS